MSSLGQLVKLESLNASWNNVTALPSSITRLVQLKYLDISNNQSLTSLPESFTQLAQLESLDISNNKKLTSIPKTIGQLTQLEVLDISNNISLTSIPKSLHVVGKLVRLNCNGCVALSSPPLTICNQGITAVKKYLSKQPKDQDSESKLIPVMVIGKSKAGKISLVRSVQEGQRVLTKQSAAISNRDQATQVFDVIEAETDSSSRLIFLIHGGHEMNHFAYKFQALSVPLIVINIAEFDNLARASGLDIACQDLCIKFLSHLYLSHPQAGRPVLVVTHGDLLTERRTDQRKEQLLATIEKLRLNMIQTEKAVAPDSPFFSMVSFCDTSKPLISETLVLSDKSDTKDIELLKFTLCKLGSNLTAEAPGKCYEVLQYLSAQTDIPFIRLSDVLRYFPDEKVSVQYLKESGRIVWLHNIDKLSDYVFHQPWVLAYLIKVLFDHTKDHSWDVDSKSKGVIDAALLRNLLNIESGLPIDVSITILKAFHIICGPITTNGSAKFIIPYLSTQSIALPTDYSNLVPLKVDLYHNGLSIPNYFYNVMTASFIDTHIKQFCSVEAGMNGALVQEDDGKLQYLFHNIRKRRVSLISLTPANNVCAPWMSQRDTVIKLSHTLESLWKGARYEHVFYCSNCLLSRHDTPITLVNSTWINPTNQSYGRCEHHTPHPVERCLCPLLTNHARRMSAPKPLVYPCEFLDNFYFIRFRLKV